MRAMADVLALRLRPDCSPLTYAKPISPVLFGHCELGFAKTWKRDLQERVFAEVLFDTAPAELSRKIKYGREDVRDAEALCFVCNGRGCLFQKVRVERCGQADWGGPDRPIVREPVET